MSGSLATKLARFDVAGVAAMALRLELNLTPKPGLVDLANNGSHCDMDHAMFLRSIAAIAPWFRVFEKAGFEHALKPASEQLRLLRPAGMACEQAMFEATGGVNTHKAAYFLSGLSVLLRGDCGGKTVWCAPNPSASRSVKSVKAWWRENWLHALMR